MDMANNPQGYGLGIPWHYVYGFIILFFIVVVIVALIKRRKRRE
jgi:hypothetical protein